MIIFPVGLWIAFNAIVCVSTLIGRGRSKALGFSMGFGIALITTAALASGMTGIFLAIEMTLWTLQILICLLTVALRPPGKDVNGDVGALALSATIRLTIAMSVWFCS